MKKTFILLFALGAAATTFAQGGYNNREASRDVILGNDRSTVYNDNRWPDNNRYETDSRRRDEEIRKLNKDYDFQVAAVKRNRYLNAKEKSRQLQRLERDRAQKLQDIYQRYAKNTSYNDRNGKRF